MRLASGAWRAATAVIVPLLAGMALAAFSVLTIAALNSARSEHSHDLSVLKAQRRHTETTLQKDSAKLHTTATRFQHLVASAAAHEAGAEQQVADAKRLRIESETAQSKADALKSSLAQLLDEEAARDQAARHARAVRARAAAAQ